MKHITIKTVVLAIVAVTVAAAIAAIVVGKLDWGGLVPGAAQIDKVKAGFVYVGPTNDNGWTYRHDQGRLTAEKALGGEMESTFVETVSEGAAAERVIQQLAASGHDIIFTTSFGYMNPTLKVAKRFPNVKFEHATGFKRDENVATYNARFYEGRTVAGIIAARMTKANVIGYIGAFPIPEVVRGINATIIAARRINPNVIAKVVWANTWHDPAKEADAAKVLLDQGADIIMQHTDSAAPCQIAQERGAWCVGQAADQSAFAPKAQLTAIVNVWGPYYTDRIKAVMDGTWTSGDTWGGLAAGMVEMAPLNAAIPSHVQAEANMAIADLKSGTLHSFQGPITDQSGKLVIMMGEQLDDGVLAGMDWYVQGVQGSLPK